MPLLTGDHAKDPASFVIEQLETIVAREIILAPWLARFAPYGGVACLSDQVEGARFYSSKKPFYFFELADIRIAPDSNTPDQTHWLIEISIEAVTNDSNSPIEKYLRAALLTILNNAFDELVALGIEGSEIKAGQGRDQRPDRKNPHTFSCEVFTELP